MRKVLLIVGLAAASLLGGCVAVYEEHRAVRHPRVIYGPPCGVVEVVPVPPPHYHHYHRYPRHW